LAGPKSCCCYVVQWVTRFSCYHFPFWDDCLDLKHLSYSRELPLMASLILSSPDMKAVCMMICWSFWLHWSRSPSTLYFAYNLAEIFHWIPIRLSHRWDQPLLKSICRANLAGIPHRQDFLSEAFRHRFLCYWSRSWEWMRIEFGDTVHYFRIEMFG
jgi:hypothetical protein